MMIAGQPGSLKSMFAQWYVTNMGIPTLYFCADSDSNTAITRLIAERTGYLTDQIVEALENGGEEYYESYLKDSKIHFCFDSGPTLGDIADELEAYIELWDRFPRVILIDNLLNVEAELGEDFSGMRLIAKELHRLSRETGAAVIVLHHMREVGNPLAPQPRSELQGKVAQLPERILSVAFDHTQGCFRIAVVKNRGGPSDSTGGTSFPLRADPARASFFPWSSFGGTW